MKTKHDSQILAGIPAGVWADYWATQQEEKGRSFGGQNLIDVAPKPPAWAKKWAKEVADEIVEMNGTSLEDLYLMVERNGYPNDRKHFGFLLGMEAVGHGVSWSDDTRGLKHDAIKLPRREFYR